MKAISVKIGLCSILVFFMLFFPAAANNTTSGANNSENVTKEYFIIADDQPLLDNNPITIFAEEKLEFRIFDSKSKKFTTDGVIKLEFNAKDLKNEELKIEQHGITEALKDFGKGLISKITGGESASGNDSEYYIDYPFVETSENYSAQAIGEYASIQTKNKIIINVKTNYINQLIVKNEKTYTLASLNTLNNRSLKYHKNDAQKADTLLKDVGDFLAASKELQNKINGLTSRPQEAELKNLPVNRVIENQQKMEKSIKEFESKTNEKLIKNQLSTQLNSIKDDGINITNELATNLNTKKSNLLEKELKEAKDRGEKKTEEFTNVKSDFRNAIFIPAGALILLGFIIGYLNVNRWKKESEYFGLYTSKANITSPITIAIILTIVILLLIGAVIYSYGDFGMLKFLI